MSRPSPCQITLNRSGAPHKRRAVGHVAGISLAGYSQRARVIAAARPQASSSHSAGTDLAQYGMDNPIADSKLAANWQHLVGTRVSPDRMPALWNGISNRKQWRVTGQRDNCFLYRVSDPTQGGCSAHGTPLRPNSYPSSNRAFMKAGSKGWKNSG